MKVAAWFVVASALAITGSSHAGNKKIENEPKMLLDVLDKVYGIKMKSVVTNEVKPLRKAEVLINEDTSAAKTRIAITLAFTRDMRDLAELRSLHETFVASTGVPFRFDNCPLIFHFFDADNVCIDKLIITAIEGDLSGVNGDAFRIFLNCPTDVLTRTKKVEARYYLPQR